MKTFFRNLFTGILASLIAGLIFIFIGYLIISNIAGSSKDEITVKPNSVLHISFTDEISDRDKIDLSPVKFNFKKTLGVKSITDAIKKAETDENIKGIWIETGFFTAGMAITQEIRNAISEFKKSNKFVITSADLYSHKSYYLATAADEIYLTPEGEIQFMGLSAQIMMYKSMLKKIGVEPEIIRHGKFKSAVEPFMLDEISEANREQVKKFIGSIWNNIIEGVSKERNISVEKLNIYADSLYVRSAQKCLDLKLVDGLFYRDMIVDNLKERLKVKNDKDFNLLSLNDYIEADNKKDLDEIIENDDNKIAIIYAVGDIESGTGTDNAITSESMSKIIRKARKDSTIKAIVLRINSPGGSALASEVIWRETVLAQKAKPLIVSMGDVAASGGYYIACYADTIVAQPNTITGSIGVFGLLFNSKELMRNIGINISVVNTNKYSDLANPSRKMTNYEREIIQKSVEEIYETFVIHVAEGRNMDIEKVKEIAEGRVWSGTDALEIGLVDVLGGLDVAIDIAAKKANLKNYGVVSYPEKDKFDRIIEDFFSETKSDISKNELGKFYKYYKTLQKIGKIKGVQARIPYYMEVN